MKWHEKTQRGSVIEKGVARDGPGTAAASLFRAYILKDGRIVESFEKFVSQQTPVSGVEMERNRDMIGAVPKEPEE
jgi:hypothetical protein